MKFVVLASYICSPRGYRSEDLIEVVAIIIKTFLVVIALIQQWCIRLSLVAIVIVLYMVEGKVKTAGQEHCVVTQVQGVSLVTRQDGDNQGRRRMTCCRGGKTRQLMTSEG